MLCYVVMLVITARLSKKIDSVCHL